jgi:hypothetical protein
MTVGVPPQPEYLVLERSHPFVMLLIPMHSLMTTHQRATACRSLDNLGSSHIPQTPAKAAHAHVYRTHGPSASDHDYG